MESSFLIKPKIVTIYMDVAVFCVMYWIIGAVTQTKEITPVKWLSSHSAELKMNSVLSNKRLADCRLEDILRNPVIKISLPPLLLCLHECEEGAGRRAQPFFKSETPPLTNKSSKWCSKTIPKAPFVGFSVGFQRIFSCRSCKKKTKKKEKRWYNNHWFKRNLIKSNKSLFWFVWQLGVLKNMHLWKDVSHLHTRGPQMNII